MNSASVQCSAEHQLYSTYNFTVGADRNISDQSKIIFIRAYIVHMEKV
jgi:hypothetical protein